MARLSIRNSILVVALLSIVAALGTSTIVLRFLDNESNYAEFRAVAILEAKKTASIAALGNSIGFEAREAVASLAQGPDTTAIAIFDSDGRAVATYGQSAISEANLSRYRGDDLESDNGEALGVWVPVLSNGKRVGGVYLERSRDRLNQHTAMFRNVLIGVSGASGLVAALLSLLATPLVVRPLRGLGAAVQSVLDTGTYNVRVESRVDDEIGELTVKFNTLLGEIDAHNNTLKRVNDDLELRVRQRTLELESEILERHRTETALETTNHELQATIEQLRQMAKTAQEASNARTQFLANMGHEIRTPMNGVIGMTELLIDTGLSPEQTEYAQTIKRSAEGLMRIINDLLDFSKVEAGKMDVEEVPFSLEDVVDEIASLFAIPAAEKGVALHVAYDQEVPALLVGDPVRFKQVISNLCSNAIKFTNEGEIRIEVRCGVEVHGDIPVRVSVTDSGIGISKDRQSAIFESFTQADGSTTRKYGGTGLGLTISRQLAELMGGTLSVQSQVGSGSAFHLEVKLPVLEAPFRPPSTLRDLRILLISSSQTLVRAAQTYCSAAGCALESVPTMAKATRLVNLLDSTEERFDIVMIHGLHEHSADPGLLGLPAIFLREPSTDPKGGGNDSLDEEWLTLPLLRRPFYALLSRLHSKAQVSVVADDGEAVDATILVADDNPIVRAAVGSILQRAGFKALFASTGVEAIRVFESHPELRLILMDSHMPSLSGAEAATKIRHTSGVPIVMLTEPEDCESKEYELRAFNGFLAKPLDHEMLLKVVREHASLVRPAIDMNQLLANCGNDRGFAQQLLAEFVAKTPEDTARLEEAMTSGDNDKFERLTQKMRASCLAIGATRAAAILSSFEALEIASIRDRHFETLRSELEAVYESIRTNPNIAA